MVINFSFIMDNIEKNRKQSFLLNEDILNYNVVNFIIKVYS